MSKVVYLLGAGSSYGKREKDSNGKDIPGKILEGLPIANEIPLRLQQIIELYSEPTYNDSDTETSSEITVNLKNAQSALVDDLQWLYDNIKRHATIDTFAKKLFLTQKKDEYIKLKRLLSIYFKTEQLINRPDDRYDTFLASVLQRNTNGKLRISNDIAILTWNYDSQFEIAYREYLTTDVNSEDIQFPEQLGIDIHSDAAKYAKPSSFHDDGTRQIFKLNGSAAFASEFSMGHYYAFHDGKLTERQIKQNLWTYFAPYYIDTLERKKSLLNFAWEHEKTVEYIELLDNAISGAEILVVIGYTFPFFNREVDTFLFKFLRKNLRTIYIQDPNANNIKESVLNIIHRAGGIVDEKNILLKKDIDQFFLPPEL